MSSFKHNLFLCPIAKWTQFLPSIFKYIHPCIRAKYALDKNKINYNITWVPFFKIFRKNVKEISNQSSVPVWINIDNDVIFNSYKIKSMLK